MRPALSESQIQLDAYTTRASVTDLDALESSSSGFTVYAVENGNETDFYISNGIYKYTSGSWGWTVTSPAKVWPEDSSSYPMTFYALYTNGSGSVSTSTTAGSTKTLNYDVTIATAPNQVDIVAAVESPETRPSGGLLTLNFGHILSRINVDFTTESTLRVHIQSVNVAGLDDNRIYDAISQSWTDDATDDNSKSYVYLATANPAYQLVSDMSGVSSTSNNGTVIESLTTLTTDDKCYGSLMLMPQQLVAWSASSIDVDDARVEVIYRISNLDASGSTESDDIGYADATQHPDYATSGSSAKELFIKVAFPMDTEWNKNLIYSYSAQLGGLGTSGGLYMDDTYYDENGNDTDLLIDTAEVGESVNDNNINFTPVVTSWGAETTEILY